MFIIIVFTVLYNIAITNDKNLLVFGNAMNEKNEFILEFDKFS